MSSSADPGSRGGECCAVRCARLWLARILDKIGAPARIEVRRRNGLHILNARCGAGGPLAIGPRGETLAAVQLLIARIVERACPGGEGCVVVDVEGYSHRRRENVVRRARRAADEVRESGEPTVLEALNSYERFLVHSALREDARVVVTSEGEGRERRVVIAPAGR